MDFDRLRQAIVHGVKCASCTYTTIAKKPADMHCPWCYQEQQERIEQLQNAPRDLSSGQAIYIICYLIFSMGFAFFIGRYCFPYAGQ